MIEMGLNTIQTSSCGRLFDAVSSLIGVRQQITFEGQAAIELEMIADPSETGRYGFAVSDSEPAEVDFRTAIREIADDLTRGVRPSSIAAKFHNTVAEAIAETCAKIRTGTQLNRVVLSGGTFQNMLLLERALALLRRCGFEVLLHRNIPPNDGGIALGQAAVAAALVGQAC
jgi:hydrogenase maturation protein HypF